MKNLYIYSKNIINCIESNKDFLNYILKVCSFEENFLITPQMIDNLPIENGQVLNFVNTQRNRVNETVGKIVNHIKTKRPDEVYENIKKMVGDFSGIDESVFSEKNDLIDHFKDFIQQHIDAYSERRSVDAFNILQLSKSIQSHINILQQQSEFILNSHEQDQMSPPASYNKLSIVSDKQIVLFSSYIELQESINELYEFICTLIKEDPNEFPLIVSNIQTGSWITEFFGIDKAVELIEKIIMGFGRFARDIITGKIKSEQIQNECESIEACMRVYEIAKKNGIKNAEVGFSPKVSKFIENLYKNSSSLQINEAEVFKLEEEKNGLRLGNSDEALKIEHIKQLETKDK